MISSKRPSLFGLKLITILIIVVGMATITVSGVAVAQADSETNGSLSEEDRTGNNDTIITQLIELFGDLIGQPSEQPSETTGNENESSGEELSDDEVDSSEEGEPSEDGSSENENEASEEEETSEDESSENENESSEGEPDEEENEPSGNEEPSEDVSSDDDDESSAGETDEEETSNKPALEDVSLETEEVSDGTELQLTVTAESNVPVDWLHISLEGPNGNIRGGGQEWEFTEIQDGIWETEWTYTVSDEAASGEYYFDRVHVENERDLESDPWPSEPSVTIDTGANPEAPSLQDVSLETSNVSDGTELQLAVTAESNTTVDWLSISLEGPNGNIRGGGQGWEFTEIEDGVWETEWTYTVSDGAASGEYYFDRVQVENKADLESDPWPEEPSVTIDTGANPEPPSLQDVSLETSNVSDGTELQLTVEAESNVPVDWLHISLEGPNGNIRGGGQGWEFTEVEEGIWETEWTYTVSDEAASGEYYFDRVHVENEGDLQSDPWPSEPSVTIDN
ncbi:hypothetical protein [Halonotius roseus]|uniref:Uncharacterized protein n=1 Tax=Halonotius roseus TaxID=2511997 RepID=A0A544QQX3_9EURY|nr:hypothetical protein [Halonotius roseus]TQQ81838.1 hypothetical protein EWF95_02570 [Halonotius roseus]